MKNSFYKKLLSIILTAMLILATIPFSCISVLAEEAGVPVLYASQISNGTHLTLNSDTELIMDKELHIKSITGEYNLTVTGSEPLNITNAERTIEVHDFICYAPLIVTSTSEKYDEPTIKVWKFAVYCSELTIYGNYPLSASNININSIAVNIRALKECGMTAFYDAYISCETLEINSENTAIRSQNCVTVIVSKYCIINSNRDGIATTASLSTDNNIYLGGRIIINAERFGLSTQNGCIYSKGSLSGNARQLPALEQLHITADEPISAVGVINLRCADAKITATGKDEPAIEGTSTYLGGVYDIKTNGGYGVVGKRGDSHFYSGYFKMSGPKGDYSAVKCIVLTIDEGLSVHTPQGATYDSEGIYDSNGNPAKEVEIYGIMDSMEIEMHKPVAGMKPVSDIRVLIGAFPLPSNCELSEIKWYENDNRMTEGMVFTAGKEYRAEVVIYTTNYLCFPSGYMGKVNGKKVSTGLSNHNTTIHLRPNFGTCPEAVEEVALNIATPVDGKKPSTAVTASSSAYYVPTNSVKWEVFSSDIQTYTPMVTSTFIGGRHYKVSFDVVANSGYGFPVELINPYDFDSCVTATVNGKPAYVYAVEEASTSKIRVSMLFGECNATIIRNIRIEVTPPKAGEHPDYTARVLGTGYSINTSKNSYYDAYWANQKWYYVKNGVSWWDVTDGGYDYVYDKDVFLPDHKYQCEVYVKTDDGYEFLMNTKTDPPTVPSVIVNGNPGAHTTLYGSGLNFEQEVKYVFNCSKQTLSKVGVIELSQPIAGGTPDYVATTLAPHLYEVTKITWYDALGEELPANTTFIAGMVYRVDVQVETNIVVDNNIDYRVAYFDCFTGKTSLNGVELEMINSKDANKEDLEEYFNHAYYTGANKPINLCYTFKPAPRPAIGGITVSGTATSFGSNTDDVTIQLIKSGEPEASYETVVKGKIAEYSIEGVSAGTYTMKVMKQNHVTREYTVTVGSSNVVQDVKIHLKGDITGDGKVNTFDIVKMNLHAKKKTELTGYELLCGDITGDGKVNTFDIVKANLHAKKKTLLW